jgi:hypothetical protein
MALHHFCPKHKTAPQHLVHGDGWNGVWHVWWPLLFQILRERSRIQDEMCINRGENREIV